MIRINLLPFRAARKKENVRRQISIYALSVVCLVLLMGLFFLNLNRKVNALKEDRIEKKKELATYAETTKKINELKKKIAEIRAKLDVIKDLESKKTGPVLLLDELSMAVPKEKLWLTSLDEKKGILSVDLKSTKLKNLKQYKLNVIDFDLTCKIYSYKEETKPKTKKKG
jgi:type IV pilus assembly protein PilN